MTPNCAPHLWDDVPRLTDPAMTPGGTWCHWQGSGTSRLELIAILNADVRSLLTVQAVGDDRQRRPPSPLTRQRPAATGRRTGLTPTPLSTPTGRRPPGPGPGGAATTSSGTNPSHGNVHSATDSPNRSAGPRPRPGSTNATSAGARVKNRNNSSRPISGNPRSRSSSSSANTCVANRDLPPTRDSQLRRLLRHIRPIFGEYYPDPLIVPTR